MSELIVNTGHIVTNATHKMFDGREYAVVPAVALVAGVLNGQYAPATEIGRYVDAWNGRPVVLKHPRRNGEYITANSPDVLSGAGLGFFFGARMDEVAKLHGELWVDVRKAQQLGGDALTVLERMEGGQPVELSSAYFSDLEPASGVFNGKAYDGIQRNLRPDHIAILPDEMGACSWLDGCGAPRVNCQCPDKPTEVVVSEEKRTPEEEVPVLPTQQAEEEKEAEVTEAEVHAPAPQTPVVNRQAPVIPPELTALVGLVNEFGGVTGLRQVLGGLRANADRQRTELVGRLVANQACAFSKADLDGMTVEQLEKLDRSLAPSDYTGRAGGFTANQESEWVAYERPQAKSN